MLVWLLGRGVEEGLDTEGGDLLCRIHDPRSQNQLTSSLSPRDFQSCKARSVDIIRSVQQNDVHKSHSHEQRQDSQNHDPILEEDLLRSDIPPTYSEQNYRNRIECTPPRHQQRRLVFAEVPQGGSRSHEAADEVHDDGLGELKLEHRAC